MIKRIIAMILILAALLGSSAYAEPDSILESTDKSMVRLSESELDELKVKTIDSQIEEYPFQLTAFYGADNDIVLSFQAEELLDESAIESRLFISLPSSKEPLYDGLVYSYNSVNILNTLLGTEYSVSLTVNDGTTTTVYRGILIVEDFDLDIGLICTYNMIKESYINYDVVADKISRLEYFTALDARTGENEFSGVDDSEIQSIERVDFDAIIMAAATKNESESNNTQSLANEINDDDTIYGKIGTASDVDYYKVKFTKDGLANFWLGQIPSGKDYDFYLYNASGSELASSKTINSNAQEQIYDYPVTANTYYFMKVVGYASAYDASRSYAVRAKNYPRTDDHGNDFAVATPIQVGANRTTTSAVINYSGDVDFFKITTTKSGVYAFTSTGISLYGYLFNRSKGQLAYGNGNFSFTYNLISGQTYYLQIKAISTTATGNYQFSMSPAYTATYSGNGYTSGTVPNSQTWFAGSSIVMPSSGTLAKSGYMFAGWNTNASGTGTTYSAGAAVTLPNANITLYAKWTAVPSLTVTYNGNANTSGSVPSSQTWASGSTLTLRTNTGALAKTGYTFDGWNTNSSGTGTSYAAGSTVNLGSSSLTLYAKWKPNTNTVTYNGNLNTSGSAPASQTWTTGTTLTLRTNTYTLSKTGYTFDGWNTSPSGTGTSYAAGSTVNLGSSSLTLYAKWKPNTNTVTYNGNLNTSGSAPASQTWTTGTTLTLRTNTGWLARTEYIFDGWNTNSSGTGTSYAVGSTVELGSSSLTLYAKWKPITYTITYNGNGNTKGTAPASQTFTAGQSVKLQTNVNSLGRTGCTFDGWNTKADGTGTDYSSGQTISPSSANLTLYSKWRGSDVFSGGLSASRVNPLNYNFTTTNAYASSFITPAANNWSGITPKVSVSLVTSNATVTVRTESTPMPGVFGLAVPYYLFNGVEIPDDDGTKAWTRCEIIGYDNQMNAYKFSNDEKISNFSHEFGHALGLDHPSNSSVTALMKQGQQSIAPQAHDIINLITKWGK